MAQAREYMRARRLREEPTPEQRQAAVERTRKWRKNNHSRACDLRLLYHARKTASFVEVVRRDVLYERDDGICGICGAHVSPDSFQVDHVIPLSKGGEHSYANTRVAHPLCNNKKGARIQ